MPDDLERCYPADPEPTYRLFPRSAYDPERDALTPPAPAIVVTLRPGRPGARRRDDREPLYTARFSHRHTPVYCTSRRSFDACRTWLLETTKIHWGHRARFTNLINSELREADAAAFTIRSLSVDEFLATCEHLGVGCLVDDEAEPLHVLTRIVIARPGIRLADLDPEALSSIRRDRRSSHAAASGPPADARVPEPPSAPQHTRTDVAGTQLCLF